MDTFDIVMIDDQTMDVPSKILNMIVEAEGNGDGDGVAA